VQIYNVTSLSKIAMLEVKIRKEIAEQILQGRQIVKKREVKALKVKPGTLVEVFCGNEFICVASANPKSNFALRVVSLEKEHNIEAILEQRLKKAKKMREKVGYKNTFRWVFSEADLLSGLIIDKYENVAVMQISNPFFDRIRNTIAKKIVNVCKDIEIVYERNDYRSRILEGLKERKGILLGDAERLENMPVIEQCDRRFYVDFINGQKTGFFLDQRENRRIFSKLAFGRVLDMFCYTGSFGICAEKAEEIHFVEKDKQAIEVLKRNLEINSIEDRARIFTEDAFKFVKRCNARYDCIVLDPPAYLQEGVPKYKAMKSYYLINYYSLRLLKEGGLLISCNCSQGIGREEFKELVFKAARKAGRKVKLIEYARAAYDHPTVPFHPELDYLKALFIYVE